MIHNILCKVIVLLSFVIGQAQNNSFEKKADSILETIVSKKTFAGLSVAISMDNQLIWNTNYGYSNIRTKTLFTEQTLTRTASISKTMTAVAIMQLIEKGHANLDVPIQQYIPEFPYKKEGTITIRNLLTHTSGISGFNPIKNLVHSMNTKQLRRQ